MADISFVDGQGDTKNGISLHFNALKSIHLKTFENKNTPELGNPVSDQNISKKSNSILNNTELNQLKSNEIESSLLKAVVIEMNQLKTDEIELNQLKPDDTELHQYKPEKIELNKLNTTENQGHANKTNVSSHDHETKTASCTNADECATLNLIEDGTKEILQPSPPLQVTEAANILNECFLQNVRPLNDTDKDELRDESENMPDSIGTDSEIVGEQHNSLELPLQTVIVKTIENKQIEICKNLFESKDTADKSCINNGTEEMDITHQYDEIEAVCESVEMRVIDDGDTELTKPVDAKNDNVCEVDQSEEDLLGESSADQGVVTSSEDIEMSEIQITESLSITDQDYLTNVNRSQVDGCEKMDDDASMAAHKDKINCEDTTQDIVILESAPVDAQQSEKDNSETECFEPEISKGNYEDATESKHTNLKESSDPEPDQPIIIPESSTIIRSEANDNVGTEILANKDNRCLSESLKQTEDVTEDEDDDVLLIDDDDDDDDEAVSSKPLVESKASKYTFKNILQKPKEVSPHSSKVNDNEHIIIDETDNDCLDKASVKTDNDDKTSGDLNSGLSESLKSDNTRKRLSPEETDNNVSKRLKTDSDIAGHCDFSDNSNVKKAEVNVTDIKNTLKEEDKEKESPSCIQTTTKVLQVFMSAHLKAFFKNQKLAKIDKLNKQARQMQSATNLWRETAKHLEKSVLELTELAKKLDKRVAQEQKLKKVTNNCADNKVSEVKMPTSSASLPVKTSDTSSVNTKQSPVPSSPKSSQSVRSQNMAPDNIAPQKKAVPKPSAPMTIAPKQPSPPKQASVPSPRHPQAQPMAKTPPQGNTLIDLTDEDDTSKKTQKRPLAPKPNTGVAPLANGYNANSSAGSSAVLMNLSNKVVLNTTPSSQPTLRPPAPVLIVNKSQQPLFAFVPTSRQSVPQSNPVRSLPAVNPPSNSTVIAKPTHSLPPSLLISSKHPAPLPNNQDTGNAPPTAKKRPPKPGLKISRVAQGIVLSWNMPNLTDVEQIASYQLFAYQETEHSVPKSSLWKKVGVVKALPLPMACTLTQFQEGNRYHFAVRAVDQYGRCGIYSDPSSIFLYTKT